MAVSAPRGASANASFVAPCLPLGDQPLDHQHRDEQDEREQPDYDGLYGGGKVHAWHLAARIWRNHGALLEKERQMKKKRQKVKAIPAEYHTVTPYLACGDAARAIAFYKKAC
jgi:hypothetical protein